LPTLPAVEPLEHRMPAVEPLEHRMPAVQPLEHKMQDHTPRKVVSSDQPETRQCRAGALPNVEKGKSSPSSSRSPGHEDELASPRIKVSQSSAPIGDEVCVAKEEHAQRFTREEMLAKLHASKELQSFQVSGAEPPPVARASTSGSTPGSAADSANTCALSGTSDQQQQAQPPHKGRDSWSFWSRTPRSPKATSSRGWSLGLWTLRQRHKPTKERWAASTSVQTKNNPRVNHLTAGGASETALTSRDDIQIGEQIPGETCGRWGVQVSPGASSLVSNAECGRHRKYKTTWQSTSTSASTMEHTGSKGSSLPSTHVSGRGSSCFAS